MSSAKMAAILPGGELSGTAIICFVLFSRVWMAIVVGDCVFSGLVNRNEVLEYL